MGEKRRPEGARYSSLGIELTAAILGFALLGYWIDHQFKTQPWGLLICSLLGIVGGLYNLIKTALKASGEAAAQDHDAEETETDIRTD